MKKTLVLSLGVAALALSLAAGAVAQPAATPLPKACKLLKRAEAQKLAGMRLQPAVNAVTKCSYTSYPTDTVGQVFIVVDSTVPTALRIDRKLGHKFWKVPKLGNEAWMEDWHVFVRKGKVWVQISLVRIDTFELYKKRLEQAARIAISRVKVAPKRKAAAVGKLPPAVGGRERWTGAERRFGDGITQYAGVTYQPAVVLIGGGAAAVRGRSPDGLTWTIAGNAPGVSDLRVGKIMLATTFAAGRVLKLSRVGPNVRVVLGPAQLTDIFRDAVFDSPKPVRIANPHVYTTKLTQPKKRRAQQADVGVFSSVPLCCGGGVGLRVQHKGEFGRMVGTLQLYASQLAVDFRIEIRGGKLQEAALELRGAGGLGFDLVGATENTSGSVESGPVTVPGEITIPLVGPLVLTLSQAFNVSMQLTGKAAFRAQGNYKLAGRLAFGYLNGGAKAGEAEIKVSKPLTKNTYSFGLGTNALSIGWAPRVMVGFGLGVGSIGAWYTLKPGLAFAADGSHPQSLKFGCVTAGLGVSQSFGVGFKIAEFVQSFVNAILGALRVKPIPAILGKEWGPYNVFTPQDDEYCIPRDGKKPPARALAGSTAKAPKDMVLQKADFPQSARATKTAEYPEKNSHFVTYRYRAGSKRVVLSSLVTVQPSLKLAKQAYRELKSSLIGIENKLRLPKYGDEQDAAYLPASDGQLVVRKGNIVWALTIGNVVGTKPLTTAQATAELLRFAPRAKMRAAG